MSWWTRIFLFQQCQWDQKLQRFLLIQRGSIMLNFSYTQLLKIFMPIAMISLLVLAYKSKIAKAYGYDCLNCKHQPNVCRFLLGLKAQNSRQLLSHLVQKDADKKCSAFSQNIKVCTSFHSLPSSPFHQSSSVIYSMLSNVKRVISFDHPSCIYHPFIHRTINLLM
jgi:hypothetical protein